MADGFVTVRLPTDLVTRIEDVMQTGGEGYNSRNAFVAEAVRNYLLVKEEQSMRREAFQEWVRGGRQGGPPWLKDLHHPWPRPQE